MYTKQIITFSQVTPTEVIPPPQREMERKERWIKAVQKTIEADWKPKIIRHTDEVINPEIENQKKFFEGAVVLYYAVQNMNLTEGKPDTKTLAKYRKEILNEILGYDVRLITKIVRERKSTTDFRDEGAWNKFLQTIKETIFESAGYEFPDSAEFWKLVKAYNYEEAKRISLETLQKRLSKKL